jgi:hypothetical protein
VKGLCAMVELSRASYYRGLRPPEPEPERLALRDEIQKIALAFSAYACCA